ncbi:DNA methyltransferase [Staphylococcus xylosus]|uniref:DNA methyltransferase n=1 Tax=Staphylococcus xylosus TaxID=1288 RepID=UPI003F557BE3
MDSIYPFNKKIKSGSHTAQYRMHKYFARRPYNVFRSLIEHYTEPNDIVLDVFCGGGVTLFESLATNRKAIGVDLNPLATFITEMQVKQVNVLELREFLYSFIDDVKKEYGFFYKNDEGITEWIEWVYEVECPECNNLISLEEKNKVRNGIYQCSNNECISNRKDKIGVRRIDCKPVSKKPINIKIRNNDKKPKSSYVRSLTKEERLEIINYNYQEHIRPNMIKPDAEIPYNWDRAQEDKLNSKGVYKFSDLFTNRNYALNVIIFNKIIDLKNNTESNLIDCLYFVFSASLRYTNNMTRVTKNWENGNPTSMDKHAYWLPNQFVETNIFDKLNNRIEAIIKGLNYTNETINHSVSKAVDYNELLTGSQYMILNKSSSDLPLPNKSISTIITDPPYGSNVQYGELSSYWNLWLKYYLGLDSFINNEEEAVMNRKKSIEGFKDVHHYENVLYQVFTECNRVLKDDGYLVFTFNNKNIKVWIALLKAIAKSGFYLPENGVVFQDFIDSYKNTSHLRFSGNVNGDFIYSFKKGSPSKQSANIISDYTSYVNNSIDKTISNLFNKKDTYTTAELYQEIFANLINIILELVNNDLQTDENRLVEFEKYSNDFVDSYLRRKLNFSNNKWFLKR